MSKRKQQHHSEGNDDMQPLFSRPVSPDNDHPVDEPFFIGASKTGNANVGVPDRGMNNRSPPSAKVDNGRDDHHAIHPHGRRERYGWHVFV